ncbi:hypothetical protein DB30_06614 [Enhygromyxa salina]|uniref:Uncharacterized protein n=1 Tax=Enhygromyxa salina TaxID=215803 RepID=A0A0C2A6J6_9BACT|nr:hypothetical protein [Enhygromyxa salina]KIG19003.1 hypothetical protein DB30_06614 [Enhygromyxa salina]
MRHTFVTRLAAANVPARSIMELAGRALDGVFARVAEAPEPERGGFFLVHALELRGEPVVARGWGEVELLSWPELQLEVTYEQGSLHIHALDRRVLLINNRGSQIERPVVVIDPDTGRSEALAVVGRERQWTAAPGGGAVALFEHEGRHTLTWLWAVHGEASTNVSLRQFPWASGWGLLGATELDGDPEPELVGGCSSVGCSSATRLRELDDTNTRAFMDRAGTITWVRAGTISQLRCEQ